MDLQQLMPWLVAAQTILSLGTVVYTMMSSGATKVGADLQEFKKSVGQQISGVEAAANDRMKEIEDGFRKSSELIAGRFNLQEIELAKIHAAFEHLPDRKQAHDLAMAVEKMSGQIAAMDARMTGRIDTLDERLKPVDALGRRLQDLLVRQAEKAGQ